MYFRYLKLIFVVSILIVSCKGKIKYKTTDTGLRYIFYTEHKGLSPRENYYVTLDMVYKLENDSVLYDSRDAGMPLRYQLTKPPFEGSLEEGIMMMSEGDSATFSVSADSMYAKFFKKPMPDFVKKGSRMVF